MTTSHSATVTLQGDTGILIEREFDAPPELVWEAWTKPEHVRRWWHTGRGEMTDCTIDLRVGGGYRYAMVTSDGQEVAFHGEHLEIEEPHRLVSTEVYEAIPGAQAVNTLTLEPLDGGRTRLRIAVEHESREYRDGHMESGMEDGLQDALDLLEELAVSLG